MTTVDCRTSITGYNLNSDHLPPLSKELFVEIGEEALGTKIKLLCSFDQQSSWLTWQLRLWLAAVAVAIAFVDAIWKQSWSRRKCDGCLQHTVQSPRSATICHFFISCAHKILNSTVNWAESWSQTGPKSISLFGALCPVCILTVFNICKYVGLILASGDSWSD